MRPDRAVLYLGKKDINVIDLFKHYKKKRLYSNENTNCPFCGKTQKEVNRTKIFYTSPLNLILMIDYDEKDENKFKLNIDELINLQEFVERKDISKVKVKYRLIGAIFSEKNENENKKYVSITKNQNGQWYYFDGESIKKSSLNDLINHKKVRILIYSAL